MRKEHQRINPLRVSGIPKFHIDFAIFARIGVFLDTAIIGVSMIERWRPGIRRLFWHLIFWKHQGGYDGKKI